MLRAITALELLKRLNSYCRLANWHTALTQLVSNRPASDLAKLLTVLCQIGNIRNTVRPVDVLRTLKNAEQFIEAVLLILQLDHQASTRHAKLHVDYEAAFRHVVQDLIHECNDPITTMHEPGPSWQGLVGRAQQLLHGHCMTDMAVHMLVMEAMQQLVLPVDRPAASRYVSGASTSMMGITCRHATCWCISARAGLQAQPRGTQ